MTAGIHKIAGTLTKTTKKKSAGHDKQATSTSPIAENSETDGSSPNPSVERKVSFEDKVGYVDRQASTQNLLDGDKESKKDDSEVGVHNEGETNDEGQQADGYLVLREATVEEKEVELKVQQKIEALKRGGEGSQPVSNLLRFACF